MAEEITESTLRGKDWVSPSDEIEKRGESSLFEWRHDSYMAFTQMQEAIMDSDVEICDVECSDDSVVVNLQARGGGDRYPGGDLLQLRQLALERFRQKQHDQNYGEWDEENLWWHLNSALGQVDDAMCADEELETKEQIADAVNYLLFAYSVIDGNDS
jgi:hypothetical protein